jgi:predicted DNA-binding transcriptional regulator AlpA
MSTLTPRAADLYRLPAGARLDTKDLQSLFSCSKSTLMRRVAQGRAPAPVELGRWRADSVREFFEEEVQQ